jgi:hypothetical protein
MNSVYSVCAHTVVRGSFSSAHTPKGRHQDLLTRAFATSPRKGHGRTVCAHTLYTLS